MTQIDVILDKDLVVSSLILPSTNMPPVLAKAMPASRQGESRRRFPTVILAMGACNTNLDGFGNFEQAVAWMTKDSRSVSRSNLNDQSMLRTA